VNRCKQARLAALAAPDVPAVVAEQASAVAEEAPAVAEELQDCRLSFSFQFVRGDRLNACTNTDKLFHQRGLRRGLLEDMVQDCAAKKGCTKKKWSRGPT